MRLLQLFTVSLLVLLVSAAFRARADIYDVADMAKAGVSEEVLLAYVEKSDDTYDLSSEDIKYLNDIGVPEAVINAMAARPAPVSDVAVARARDPQVRDFTQLVTAPGGEPAEDYFYTALAPYGTWIQTGTYGHVWQPYHTLVHANWAPYRDGGRWVYGDQTGWLWDSDYSWGWAAFHYGRWAYLPGQRWVWVPDYTWAPAWVSWRSFPDNCGWAPLPPEAVWTPGIGFSYFGRNVAANFHFGLGAWDYSFLPVASFGYHDYGPHYLDPWIVSPFFPRTNLVAGIAFQAGGIFNAGLAFDFIDSHSRRHLRRWHVEHDRGEGGRPFRSGWTDGGNYHVFAPHIRPGAEITPEIARARDAERLQRIEGRTAVRRARQDLKEGRLADRAVIERARTEAAARRIEAERASKDLRLAERAEAQRERQAKLAASSAQAAQARENLQQERLQAAQLRGDAARQRHDALLTEKDEQRQKRLSEAEARRERASGLAAERMQRQAERTAAKAEAERVRQQTAVQKREQQEQKRTARTQTQAVRPQQPVNVTAEPTPAERRQEALRLQEERKRTREQQQQQRLETRQRELEAQRQREQTQQQQREQERQQRLQQQQERRERAQQEKLQRQQQQAEQKQEALQRRTERLQERQEAREQRAQEKELRQKTR